MVSAVMLRVCVTFLHSLSHPDRLSHPCPSCVPPRTMSIVLHPGQSSACGAVVLGEAPIKGTNRSSVPRGDQCLAFTAHSSVCCTPEAICNGSSSPCSSVEGLTSARKLHIQPCSTREMETANREKMGEPGFVFRGAGAAWSMWNCSHGRDGVVWLFLTPDRNHHPVQGSARLLCSALSTGA